MPQQEQDSANCLIELQIEPKFSKIAIFIEFYLRIKKVCQKRAKNYKHIFHEVVVQDGEGW